MKEQTQEDKRAAAVAARTKADDARKAATDAGGTDETLNQAATELEATATQLEEAAKAPSHDSNREHQPSKKEKIMRRMEILREQYVAEGGDPKDFDEDEAREEAEDLEDKPLTHKDLERMGVVKTAETMAGEIQDADTRAAVQEALQTTVSKTLPHDKRYQAALAIASSAKSSRVASEASRIAGRRVSSHGSGGGAPAKRDDVEFTPTVQEAAYMKRYKLTKDDIIKSREDASNMNFATQQKEDE